MQAGAGLAFRHLSCCRGSPGAEAGIIRCQVQKRERPEPDGLARAALKASIFPEVFEALRRKLGISYCVGDVLVAEILLNRPRVSSIVRQLVTRRVSQHMRVNRKRETGRNPG